MAAAPTLYRDANKDTIGTDYGMTPINSPNAGDVLTATATGTIWSNNTLRVWAGTSGGITVPVGSPIYLPPNNSLNSLPTSDTSASSRVPVTRSTTLQNFFVVVNPAPGVSKTNTFTVMTNGVASALSVSIIGTSTVGNDAAHLIMIPAGTEIGIKIITSPGSVAGRAAWSFEGR